MLRLYLVRACFLKLLTVLALVGLSSVVITPKAQASPTPIAILKCVLSTNPVASIVMCLAKEGVVAVSRTVLTEILGNKAQELYELCYNPMSLVDLVINDCKVGDPPDWQRYVTPPAQPQDPPRQPYHGIVPDGMIVQSLNGHNLYVGAGTRLFWFDQNNAPLREALLVQRRQRFGEVPYLVMTDEDLHAVEVNRDNAGSYVRGAHMPADNTFLYEYGNSTQYIIKYQHPFPIGGAEELSALGGVNRAVMVPPSIGDLQSYSPQWINEDLLQFWGSPQVWHYAGVGRAVGSVPTRDCLMVTRQRVVTLMPSSARSSFPTTSQPAGCDFPHGQWLFGSPSGKQIMVLYGAGFYIDPSEIAPLNGTNRAVGVTDETVNGLLTRGVSLPNGHIFRAVNSVQTYLFEGGQFHYISGVGMRDCLAFRNQMTPGMVAGNDNGVEAVPQSFIDKFSKGSDAGCKLPDDRWAYDASNSQQYLSLFGGFFQVGVDELTPLHGTDRARPLSHEGTDFLERQNNFVVPDGEIVQGVGSLEVYFASGNQLHHIQNPLVRDCLLAAPGRSLRLVPQDLVSRMRALGRISSDIGSCSVEGKQLLSPNGVDVAYVSGNVRRPVQNAAIRDCLAVRAGAGQPGTASSLLWNNYPSGSNARCPYETEPGLNFVRENGDPTVWLVQAGGIKRHVGSLCVSDASTTNLKQFHVFVVPRGETGGHVVGPDWFASDAACAALPTP